MNTTYPFFDQRRAWFIERINDMNSQLETAATIDWLGLTETCNVGELTQIVYGESALMPNHADWLDEQATRGCEPYHAASTEYDEQIPF